MDIRQRRQNDRVAAGVVAALRGNGIELVAIYTDILKEMKQMNAQHYQLEKFENFGPALRPPLLLVRLLHRLLLGEFLLFLSTIPGLQTSAHGKIFIAHGVRCTAPASPSLLCGAAQAARNRFVSGLHTIVTLAQLVAENIAQQTCNQRPRPRFLLRVRRDTRVALLPHNRKLRV